MKLPQLTVIEASAGTGKTFALVTRLLSLIFNGADPEKIVALTFSRMAAGEIFNSFIERLADAARNEEQAKDEAERLKLNLSVTDFRAKLRLVIARQHLSLIGTLDSFLNRLVRMLPLELGLEGEVTIMSDYRSPVEQVRLVGEMMMLNSEDAKAVFREAFSLAFTETGERSFLKTFSDFITAWHKRYREHPNLALWGNYATIFGSTEIPKAPTLTEIREMANTLAPFAGKSGVDTFIRKVSEFSGALPDTFPKALANEPLAKKVMLAMQAYCLHSALRTTQGIYRLMHAYEAAYATKIRQRGLLTFDDLPFLINSLPDWVKLPLEYRMDARFDHWALDEFQDTSKGQWFALKNLVYENSSANDGKSVFIVGDRKQSIYEWRGGDVSILSEEVARANLPDNKLIELNESYRYLPAISTAINTVFSENAVRGLIDMDAAPKCAQWQCNEHFSHDKSAPGFVEVIEATKAKNQANISDFFEIIANSLNATKPWVHGHTTAILVRNNAYGEAILTDLKARGITQVVFEGERNIFDSPVLSAMVELVRIAEHPSDNFAYAHIQYSPLNKALYPEGFPAIAELSAQLLADFTRLGLVRKFRTVREALKLIPDSWNDFTEARFEDFIKCASEFEDLRDASMRLSDFALYLEKRTRRDYAQPGMVRILTMHQAKGLGFDHVIIPFYEPRGLVSSNHLDILTGEGWLLKNPGSRIACAYPPLAKAEQDREQTERYHALCLAYVAMTRARKALTLILNPPNKSNKRGDAIEKFSDLVRTVELKTMGDKAWYLKGTDTTSPKKDPPLPTLKRGPRQVLKKRRPSESYFSGLSGDQLFSENFGAAAKRGTTIHRELAQIEWGPNGVPPGLEAAFAKPSPDATVWRERSYELFDGEKWETGQFDRVVFTGSGDTRSAVIYDFKTGSPNANYAAQMDAYRNALSRLTQIPLSRITTQLLFL